MSDLTDRIARLSPEKRALLARHLEGRRGPASNPPKAGDSSPEATTPGAPPAQEPQPPGVSGGSIPRLPEGAAIPLSFAQERLWFLERWAPGNTFYNDFSGFRLRGRLQLTALLGALERIQQRHQVLRMTFPESEDGRPKQRLHPRNAPSAIVDLAGLEPALAERALRTVAGVEARRPFDLRTDPGLRTTLVRLSSEDHALLLSWHHIATDEWSWGVFLRELAAHYQAAQDKGAPALPPLPIQYGDFAAWQRKRLEGERFDRGLEFWRRTLADLPEALDLPTDRPRLPGQSPLGAQCTFTARPGLLHALGRNRPAGTTLFMVLLAAFQGLLSRLTGQRDIAVGTPIAGRDHPQTQALIGIFLNLLVLRIRHSPKWTFEQLRDAVRKAAIAAYEHQEIPFEKLVEHLRPVRSGLALHQPLFQCLFVLQNEAPAQAPNLSNLQLAPLDTAPVSAKYDWTLMLEPWGDTLRGRLKYDSNLFDGATAQRFLRSFESWLEQLSAAPDRPLEDLAFLSPSEQHQLQQEWNDSAVEWDKVTPLFDYFATWAEQRPEAIALVASDRQISYGVLEQSTALYARRLMDHGVGPEVRVGLCLERSTERVTAQLAILRAGGAYVPLDPTYPDDRLRHMVDDSGLELLLGQKDLRELAHRIAPTVPFLSLAGTPFESTAEQPHLEPGLDLDHLAYVIYTSGSTGRPKGVGVSHRAAVNRILTMRWLYGTAPQDRILHKTPFGFDVSVWEVFWPLVSGATMVIADPEAHRDPGALARTIAEHRVGSLHFVPSLLRAFLDHPRAPDCKSLERVFCGGEALPGDLPQRFRQTLGAQLINFYGPTETTIEATSWPCVPSEHGPVPIGRPEANTQVWVADRTLRQVSLGYSGELVIGGVQLARGYLGRPAQTAERFVPDPSPRATPGARLYRSGDQVRQRSDGALVFLGRTDQQVKVRGVRIELGELETALRALPGVRDAAALVEGQAGSSQSLVAYVVGEGLGEDRLRRQLQNSLPESMVPSAYCFVDRLPKTPSGKLDRKALQDLGSPGDARSDTAGGPSTLSSASPQRPLTPSEEVVAAVWQEVLGVPSVTPTDDFFSLGGHSLLAIQVATRLAQLFGVDVPVLEIFQAVDAADLAHRLDQLVIAGRGGERPPLVADPNRERAPLSFGQERLWSIQRMHPSSTAYNLPLLLDIQGALSPSRLAATLVTLEERHTLLRSVFPDEAGRPFQRIQPAEPKALPLIDLSALPAEHREAETDRRIAEETTTPFDLIQGPVWRRLLIRRAPQDHTLVLDFHHLVGDGWSMEILLREMLALYRAATAGEPHRLPPLPLNYADYAAWQRSWLQGEALAQELASWRQSLEGASPMDLPLDRPRRAMRTFRGAQRSRRLGNALCQTLESLAARHQATLFMVTLAAFRVLLAHYSRHRDLVVGFPVAGRHHLELEGLVGFFVNLLPSRLRLEHHETLGDILDRTRRSTLEAHTRQDVPFEELIRDLELEGDPSRPSLVQVAFTLQNALEDAGPLPDAEVRARSRGSNTSKLELTLFATRGPQGLDLVAEYSTDLFDANTIDRLLSTYCHLLEELPKALDQPWEACPLLAPAQRHQVLQEWSGADRVHEDAPTVPHRLEILARESPDAIAVASPGQALTFHQLQRAAGLWGARLIEQGVGPESVVALCLEASPNLVMAAVAAWRAGAAYLPLDPEHPSHRLLETLDDSRAAVVLTERSLEGRLEESEAKVWSLDRSWDDPQNPLPNPTAVPGRRGLAYVVYTSGSTGRPKGVAVDHGGLANLVASQRQRYDLQPQDRATQVSGLAFDATIWEIWPPLAAGASLHIAPHDARKDPAALRHWLIQKRITLGFASTPLAEALLAEPWTEASALRIFFTAGDRLHMSKPPGLDFELMNLYGPSENSVMATGETVVEDGEGLPSIGRPIVGVCTLVTDPKTLRPVPAGVGGELLLGGASLARGYLHRPRLTASCFLPDPFGEEPGARLYRTGDLVRHLADGRLDFLGRIDQQVKIRGVRVELGEVEARLRALPDVREAVVVARPAPGGGHRLVAYCVPGSEGSLEDLRRRLREQLPEAMVPTVFVPLHSLPLTPNGKVDRRALPSPDDVLAGAEAARIPPRDDVELALATLWQEVLERPQVFVHDDFFDLGGHSVLAVRLMARVAERFGRKLPMATLFEARTVAALADVLRRSEGSLERQILVPIRTRPPHREALAATASRRVVALHPIGGNVLCYQELARHLGDTQDFFALQAPAVNATAEPSRITLEEQASHYLEALRDLLVEGELPALIGWSAGGWLAFEMAQQLAAEGKTPPLVALLDSVPPQPSNLPQDESAQRLAFVQDLLGGSLPPGLDLEPLAELPAPEAMGRLLEMLTENSASSAGQPWPSSTPPELDHLLDLYAFFQTNLHALGAYRPKPYSGRVALLLTARNSTGADAPIWQQLAPGELEIHQVPGDHYSILQPPHVQDLANALQKLTRSSSDSHPESDAQAVLSPEPELHPIR